MKMRKILLFAILCAGVSSCEDFLEVNPNMGVSAEEVYSDYDNMISAIDVGTAFVHNYMSPIHTSSICEVGTLSDEAQSLALNYSALTLTYNKGLWQDKSSHDFGFVYVTGSSNISSGTAVSEPAGEGLRAIRALNLAHAGYETYKDVMVFPQESAYYTEDDYRGHILGQIYFLRAFHYFQVIRRYGPFPDMREAFSVDDVLLDAVRPTYQESTDYLVSDLDLAIENLPEVWASPNHTGRPTKEAARALKAMALLYAASPLMNDTYPYTAAATYNTEYLTRAVEASVAAITAYESGVTPNIMYTWDNIKEISTPKGTEYCQEAIYQAPYETSSSSGWWNNTGGGWYNFKSTHGGAMDQHLQPTHNCVDWYGTIDGYMMADASMSMYNYDLNSDDQYVEGVSNYYQNRDPRLYQNIIVEGADMYTSTQVYLWDPDQDGAIRAAYESVAGGVFTGYMQNKYLWPGQHGSVAGFNSSAGTGAQTYCRVLPHIRVPQIYLDFAEAANELYGPTGSVPGTSHTAESAINVVRRRVGGCSTYLDLAYQTEVPQLADVPSYYTGSKDLFREYIRNERAVELFQEFHRWFDIRRWKIAVDLFADTYNCIKMMDKWTEGGKSVYEVKAIEGAERVFEAKHYWYPIPSADMYKVELFEQNPGW